MADGSQRSAPIVGPLAVTPLYAAGDEAVFWDGASWNELPSVTGGGTVGTGAALQVPYYAVTGDALVPNPAVSMSTAGGILVNRGVIAIPPLSPAHQVLWAIGAAGENPAVLVDAVGGGPGLIMRRANGAGTGSIVLDDVMGVVGVRGYSSAGYNATGNARLQFIATEPAGFSPTQQGTQIQLWATPIGQNTLRLEAAVGPGLTVGLVTGTVPGGMQQGDINASGRIMINGVAVGGSSGPGTPGGAPQQVQFNNAGSFGGSPNLLVGSGEIIVNFNAASLPAALAGTVLQIGGAAGGNVRAELDAFGVGTGPNWTTRYARGSAGSPLAVQLNDVISGFNAFGHDGTNYSASNRGGMRVVATENWTATPAAQGTEVDLDITTTGSLTLVPAARFSSNGATIGNPASGFQGPGTLNVGGSIYSNGALVGSGSGTPGNPTAFVSATAVNGVATTYMRSDAAPALAVVNSTVGIYTNATVTVDAQGRVTNAANGTAGTGSPGGVAGNVQYNSAGTSFGGSTGAAFNASSLTSLNVALGGDQSGDMYYRNASGNLTRIAPGASGNYLQSTGATAPVWVAIATGGGTVNNGTQGQLAIYPNAGSNAIVAGVTMSQDGTINATGVLTVTGLQGRPVANTVPTDTQVLSWSAANSRWQPAPGGTGSGTVNSVGFAVPAASLFGATGSPITNAGVLGLTTTGTSGGIPYFSSGTQLNTSGILAANGVVIGGGAGAAPTTTAVGTAGQVLTSNGTGLAPTFQTGSGSGLPLTGGTITGTAPGSITIQRGSTSPPVVASPTPWHMAGADGEAMACLFDTIGGTAQGGTVMQFRRANGITGTLSHTLSGDWLGSMSFRGYGNASYSNAAARINVAALEDFTDLAAGVQFVFVANTATTVNQAQVATLGPGLTVGTPSAMQPTPTVGDINCARLFVNGSAVGPAGVDSISATVTAVVGGQGSAPLTSQFNVVTTCPVGGVVTLRAIPPGDHCIVRNSSPNPLGIYPASGVQINNQAVNAILVNTILPNSTVYFEGLSTTQCFSIP